MTDLIAAIEEDIVLGRLHPRERLVEEDLMARFNAKRHVVRQALFRLEDTGLVERIKNRGAFVKAYTPEEVEELYAMRELLELAGVERLPFPPPPELIGRLEQIQQRHGEAVENSDLSAIFHENIAFHQTLFAACGNQLLAETINNFAQKAHAIRFITTAEAGGARRATRDHVAMIEALKAQDRAELSRLCREHLKPSKESYIHLYRLRFG